VRIIYNRFVSAISYKSTIATILSPDVRVLGALPWPMGCVAPRPWQLPHASWSPRRAPAPAACRIHSFRSGLLPC
jgi:hypothetical protein